MSSKTGSERINALIVATLAQSPAEYTAAMISRKFSNDEPSNIRRSTARLKERGWIDERPLPRTGKGAAGLLLSLTDTFWESFDVVVRFPKQRLPVNDQRIFELGVNQAQRMATLPEGNLSRDFARAGYLGGAALLGERHDLAKRFDWFGTMYGWVALIAAEAAHATMSASKVPAG